MTPSVQKSSALIFIGIYLLLLSFTYNLNSITKPSPTFHRYVCLKTPLRPFPRTHLSQKSAQASTGYVYFFLLYHGAAPYPTISTTCIIFRYLWLGLHVNKSLSLDLFSIQVHILHHTTPKTWWKGYLCQQGLYVASMSSASKEFIIFGNCSQSTHFTEQQLFSLLSSCSLNRLPKSSDNSSLRQI